MDKNRWILTAVVVSVATTILDAFFHSIVLYDAYNALSSILRPQVAMMRLMPLGWGATLIFSFILVYIYHRGYEGKGGADIEGLRFGFFMGLFTGIPMATWCYVVFPLSITVACVWFLNAMIDMLLAGIIIAGLYKPEL